MAEDRNYVVGVLQSFHDAWAGRRITREEAKCVALEERIHRTTQGQGNVKKITGAPGQMADKHSEKNRNRPLMPE